MKLTVKKSKLSTYGIVKWEISINNNPVPVIMARYADGNLCLTWCDRNLNVGTVKMCRGASSSDLKALCSALSYTL